jgi:surface antigen
MDKRIVVSVMVVALALSGCSSMGPKESGGTLIGGAGGALIGSQFGGGSGRLVGVAIGTLAGALIGSEIGKSLDANDRQTMQTNTQYALEHSPTNEATEWKNPDSGHSGTIKPVNTYKRDDGRYCREYVQTVNIGGEPQQAYGKACREPDGSWKIVE